MTRSLGSLRNFHAFGRKLEQLLMKAIIGCNYYFQWKDAIIISVESISSVSNQCLLFVIFLTILVKNKDMYLRLLDSKQQVATEMVLIECYLYRTFIIPSFSVTKHNQISRRPQPEEPIDVAVTTPEGQASYQNIEEFGTCEPTYVDPIPTNLYGNDPEEDQCSYENVFPTSSIKHQSDGSDYENADFLVHNEITEDELDEPDYVNQGET
ncbi:LAT2 domain-containing protein isoform X1 [Alosa alosa]|uniref:LAT2 domain-containing protein isoform X1 n=1 Tax=Alosa alosa TaxID=278164 RepID=UPI002015233D|nr:LAT2 domain-containing protein isoform X1 [Alosa alosa]